MAERRPSLRTSLIGVAAALLVGGALLVWSAPDPEQVAGADPGPQLRPVQALRIRAVPVRSRAQLAAVLQPRRSVEIFSETSGPVVQVGAEALDRVEEGRLLVAVEPLAAEVEVERAVANLARSESELALARSNLERRSSLARRSVASDADLEEAQNAEKVAAAVLSQSRAELRKARDDLAKKTISAPFAGVLRSFDVEEGEYVGEGQKLGELLDLSTARARLGLTDRQVVAVRAGQRVDVAVEAHPGSAFEGEILRVGAAADPVNKKFPVEVELPNPDGLLLPGMVVRVRLDLDEPQLRALIPHEATVEEFGLRFVWVIEEEQEDAVVRRRRVEVRALPFRPGELEVLSGLAEGDEIALGATRQLRDGERVRREGVAPR
jgi:membrane fusion protein (multidrug efflux system)